MAKIEADVKEQLSTGQYRFFLLNVLLHIQCIFVFYTSRACLRYEIENRLSAVYFIHHFSQIFIKCSNRSFVEKPRMSWFEAKDHCESGGGKVFFLENYSKKDGKFFQKSWEGFFR